MKVAVIINYIYETGKLEKKFTNDKLKILSNYENTNYSH